MEREEQNMFKKLLGLVILASAVVLLAACQKAKVTVTFDSQGGSAVTAVTVEEGSLIEEPADPSKPSSDEESAWNFTGWYTSAAATEDTRFEFSTKITEDITLYAGWTQQLVVRFNTKTTSSVESQYLPVSGGSVSAPTAPTREGFVFGGWYYGKPGQTWLEPQAVQFPVTVTEATQFYAFWVPVSSKEVTWSAGETYKNSFTELDSDPILNPLTYHWSHESSLMTYLSTPLFGTDVNWDQAIEDGLADFKGDFSKISDQNIGGLLRENVKYGAADFPIAVGGDFDGENGVDQYGKYSEAISREISATTYRYTLRQDIYWEDGTNVTADDYFYTYFQYIDPVQNNFRASSYYPNASRSSGLRVVGARNYFLQGSEIGLGESSSNPLGGDYSYAQISRSIGPDNTYFGPVGANAGLWFGAYPKTVYLTEAQVTQFGFADGQSYDFPTELNDDLRALGWTDAELAELDIQGAFKLNPYYAGAKGTTWPAFTEEQVGFKVIDDYTFEMTFEVPISHVSAMSAADFTLVHPATYEASLDSNGTNSTYGTSATKPLSYGPFVLKSWDTGAKMVFNKNYGTFMHQYFNYKAISFEFYSNVALRMEAFEQGFLSNTGLNQTYYNDYAENPNKKDYYNGYPQYLMFNTVAYEGQNTANVSVLQDKDFRQAFFFGFNRIEYATTIYAPNVPSLLVYGNNSTQYDNDPSWYINTPEYLAMLDDLGIDNDTYGYDPVKAKALFDEAYAAWIALGNTGKITLNYLTSDGAETERLDNYIISHFTELFGSDKIAFVKNSYTSEVSSDKQDAHEFDITLTGVGTGSVTNLSVMLPIIGLFFQETYGDQFGFNTIEDLAIPASEFDITEENKIDLRATWNYLKTVTDRFDETTDAGTLWALWLILEANEGYFVGNLSVLFDFGLECTFIWAGLEPQYDGDVEDRNTVTRAFDRIILEYAPLVPTAGRASAIVYADNVVNVWPAYHNIMEWGASRYWYLNTDADFQ